MKPRLPTGQEISELLSFLPKLTAAGFEPIRSWSGGASADGKVFTLPWPEYDKLVDEFVQVASRECWLDRKYHPVIAGHMLATPDAVANADLAQIKTMLTYCIRGERFCDGHWGALIKSGKIQMLLRRLAELQDQSA